MNILDLSKTTKKSTAVEVDLVDVKAEDVQHQKEPVKKVNLKQIVDQDKINNEVDPKAKFLSDHNQKVLKETVAANHGAFQNIHQKHQQIKPQQASESQNFPQVKVTKPTINFKNLLPERDFFGQYEKIQKNKNNKNSNQAKPNVDGNPTDSLASQSRDYLPETDKGMETILSTQEFVYYTYYNRIRNQLSQFWEPKIKVKIVEMFKRGRRVASAEDRITKVQIILDPKGTLIKVQIMGESGIKDLDDVAVEAFRLAAPFPHPPKGIVDEEGTIKIRWDFVVET